MSGSQAIFCHRLPDAPEETWADTLRQRPPLTMGQAWREKEEEGLRPAEVRVGWIPGTLVVFATLPDDDIFTDVTGPNQETWRLGDVFEIFLQRAGRSDYVELHVTPANIRTQFHFERTGATRRELCDGIFSSQVAVDRGNAVWTVMAKIPAMVVSGNETLDANQVWRFSFSRYDASRDGRPPILSSTSPHQALSFHRTQEWGEMIFV